MNLTPDEAVGLLLILACILYLPLGIYAVLREEDHR